MQLFSCGSQNRAALRTAATQGRLNVLDLRRLTLPLATHLAQAVRTQLELLTQPAQHGGLVLIRFLVERTGDVVGALALSTVVDEMVAGSGRAQAAQHLGIYAGPEQREVAD